MEMLGCKQGRLDPLPDSPLGAAKILTGRCTTVTTKQQEAAMSAPGPVVSSRLHIRMVNGTCNMLEVRLTANSS